jgi:enterochelin esterase-like enzyme
MRVLILLAALLGGAIARQPFFDRTHASKVFGEDRRYRILLPPAYESSGKRYPVIYYFHGHSDRYTVERYDNGTDTIPKMAAWVAKNDAIVVCVDGYVARDYTGFYGGSPWDVLEPGGDYDFGEYFLELVAHIDSSYRTLTGRRHRATSGLSMGGFMSLYLSARYPDRIGSASSFNPGPEFYTGDKGRRVLWRPKDHVASHGRSMVRLIRASGDYISQYHEETRDAYARAHEVDFEYRRDEYNRHWATSIGETFDFHARAFDNPVLGNVPEAFSYANPYRAFEVWGYRAAVEGAGAGFVYLEGVRQGGMRVRTRRWAPDGPPMENTRITVTTPPLYPAGREYRVLDHSAGHTGSRAVTAGADGRITFSVDGAGHQVSFSGPGTGAEPPVLLPVTVKDRLRVPPAADVTLPLRVYNPRSRPMENVAVEIATEYPTVQILTGRVTIPRIEPGAAAPLDVKARFTAGAGYFALARLRVNFTYDGWHTDGEDVDVLIVPEIVPAPAAYEIFDGRTLTLPVFRQKGNQGGGGSVSRTVTEGKGNGNGVLEPGEEATIWVKMPQGMDPFDKNNWYRAKVYSESPAVVEVADLQEPKQLEWTGAKERTSLIRLDSTQGPVQLLLDNETWSYHYTPDVRYGKEKLYQAFQLHTRHLHRITIDGAGRRPASK